MDRHATWSKNRGRAVSQFVEALGALGFVLLTLLVQVYEARAQGGVQARHVRALLSAALPLRSDGYVNNKHLTFCTRFLTDFRAQSNIEYVEPVATAHTYDDAAFGVYKKRCPRLAMNRLQQCEPAVARSIREEPEAKRPQLFEKECQQYYGTANFSMYHVDIDNNPRNGKEYLFYFERAVGPRNRQGMRQMTINGGYNLINFQDCEITNAIPTNDPYDYFRDRPSPNYNGIIRYRSKHYIFDLWSIGTLKSSQDQTVYLLNLYRLEKRDRGAYCAYSGMPKHKQE